MNAFTIIGYIVGFVLGVWIADKLFDYQFRKEQEKNTRELNAYIDAWREQFRKENDL